MRVEEFPSFVAIIRKMLPPVKCISSLKCQTLASPKWINCLVSLYRQNSGLCKKDSLADTVVLSWDAWSETCWRNREWDLSDWRETQQNQKQSTEVFPETWNEDVLFPSHSVSPALFLTASFWTLVWRKGKCTGKHMEPTLPQPFSPQLGPLSA